MLFSKSESIINWGHMIGSNSCAVGTIVGAVFGVVGIRYKKVGMINPYKSVLVGMGWVVWLVLFLPITTFPPRMFLSKVNSF